jgi:hypothetical protein
VTAPHRCSYLQLSPLKQLYQQFGLNTDPDF